MLSFRHGGSARRIGQGSTLLPSTFWGGRGWDASMGTPAGTLRGGRWKCCPGTPGALDHWHQGRTSVASPSPRPLGAARPGGVTLPLTIPMGELGRPARPQAAAAPRHPLRPPAEPRSERFRQTLLPSPIPSQLQEPVPWSRPGTARPRIATALGAAARPMPRLGSPGWGGRGPQANLGVSRWWHGCSLGAHRSPHWFVGSVSICLPAARGAV